MLDELVDVIETLKSRINEYRAVLQGNEAQTRLSLIDPLLRALGWDTADPALVRPEYNLSGNWADYALLGADGKPVAIVEAKKLNETLGSHVLQMVNYANLSGVPYAGLTDGDRWELYKVFDQKPLKDRLALNVSVAEMPSYQCALQFLLLWRPNLESGLPIAASEPLLGPGPEIISDPPFDSTPGHADLEHGWDSLRNFKVESGKQSPIKLRFPNGEEKQIRRWRHILIEVVEWLIRDGALTADKCPITVGGKNYLINLEPRHRDGKDFFTHHKLSNGLFLNHHYSAKDIVKACNRIMEFLGKDPSTVHVQVG